jgi:hypothetical protein
MMDLLALTFSAISLIALVVALYYLRQAAVAADECAKAARLAAQLRPGDFECWPDGSRKQTYSRDQAALDLWNGTTLTTVTGLSNVPRYYPPNDTR